MTKGYLSDKDHRNILSFVERIGYPTEHFHKQIQVCLSQIWGYNHTVFWVADEAGNLSCPHLHQIQDKVIYDYLANYEELDFLHPKKHLNRLPEHKVFFIDDTFSFNLFETSLYFSDFIKKHQYRDEMVVNFTCKKKLVGTLGLLRPKGELPFNQKDVKRFEVLSTFISQKIFNTMLLENIEYQKRLVEAHADKSHLGLIILNASFRVLTHNRAAREITTDILLTENEKTIDFFVKKYLLNEETVNLGLMKTLYSPSYQRYNIHLVPDFNPKSKFLKEPVFLVHLMPENSENVLQPTVHHDLPILTSREMEIFHLVRKGYTNLEIAEQLFISINTVKRHIQNIFKKMDVKTRTGLLSKLDCF